jgi:trehalose utilization protein
MKALLTLAAITVTAPLLFATDSASVAVPQKPRTIVVWSEGTAPKNVYTNDINSAIVEGLKADKRFEKDTIIAASISDPDQGINDELLAKTDVLLWWGHKKHGQVGDALTAKIKQRWMDGKMGFIGLHSAHFAKPNKALMGTACSFSLYKADTTTTKVTVTDKKHPIAEGVSETFTVENHERYGDPYIVPEGYQCMFEGLSTIKKDGATDNAKMGYAWESVNGSKSRFFYFQLGHETNPIYFDSNIRKILANATEWVMPK